MTDDLVAFIRAQLGRDEKAAVSAAEMCGCHPMTPEWTFDRDNEDGGRIVIVGNPHPEMRLKLTRKWGQSYQDMFAAEHITLHDPKRELAEIAAKRAILDAIPTWQLRMADADYFGSQFDELLRLMALPFAARPGYREEWRP